VVYAGLVVRQILIDLRFAGQPYGCAGTGAAVGDAQPEHIRECITAWQPEVMILEVGLLKSAFSLSLLQDFPRMKLIGLEAEENRLVVYSGSSCVEPTPEELLQLIRA
jgi:hypothetical protein